MGESLYQFVCRDAELIKVREADLGAYLGDGPTAEQATALIESLRPIDESEPPFTPSVLWNAFKQSVEVELSWLFRERDPVGSALDPRHELPGVRCCLHLYEAFTQT